MMRTMNLIQHYHNKKRQKDKAKMRKAIGIGVNRDSMAGSSSRREDEYEDDHSDYDEGNESSILETHEFFRTV